MARSYGVLKVSVWEPGSEFRRLSPLAQWTYTMLLSQPQVSNLGVLPYTPEKWCRFASGLTLQQLQEAINELALADFAIVDAEVGELLVRTFVKHDKVWSQPKLVTNARKLIKEVESAAIHTYLAMRHPWLLDASSKAEIEAYEASVERGIETPSDRGISDTPSHTPSDTRFPPARAQDVRASHAPAGPGAGPGSGAAAEDQEQNLELELDPAAAELEAPRTADIAAAIEALNDHDRATRGVVEPLANTVPAIVFRDVVERTQTRIANGSVVNHTGLFVDLLRKASKDYRSSLARAAETVHTNPLEDARSDAAFYGARAIPWDAAEHLIARKLTRFDVPDDQRIEILDAAADAYHDAATKTVSVST